MTDWLTVNAALRPDYVRNKESPMFLRKISLGGVVPTSAARASADRQTNKRTDGQSRCVKPPLFAAEAQ